MLRFIKIDITLASSHTTSLDFLGSTLRGAFGVALKAVSCLNKTEECQGCFATQNCLYYDFFEIKNRAHAYRFSKPLHENSYNFSLYLFEAACEKLPYVLSTLHTMFGRIGVGWNRHLIPIERIVCNGVVVSSGKNFDLSQIVVDVFETKEYFPDITLHFLTPLRIKSNNALLHTTPTLEQILSSIFNRHNELKGVPLAKLPFTPRYKELRTHLEFQELSRYSNRQETTMHLGGMMGTIDYEDVDEHSYALLKLGELLGVGKQTVFGLGEIKVEHQ